MVNISAGTTELKLDAGNPKAGLLPKGAPQTRTDFGAPGYGGPCPPEGHGPHCYVFTLFAVKQEALPVNADASAAVAGFNLHFNTIEKAMLSHAATTLALSFAVSASSTSNAAVSATP